MNVPDTISRVPLHTPAAYNARIRRETEARVHYYAGHPEEIDTRLEELDREWDIERALEANAAAIAFTGAGLAATVSRKWLVLPLLVTGFLFQHAVQGWCPPLPLFRRLGFRTQTEIEEERCALKALRGDFPTAPHEGDAAERAARALAAAAV